MVLLFGRCVLLQFLYLCDCLVVLEVCTIASAIAMDTHLVVRGAHILEFKRGQSCFSIIKYRTQLDILHLDKTTSIKG